MMPLSVDDEATIIHKQVLLSTLMVVLLNSIDGRFRAVFGGHFQVSELEQKV